MKSFSDHITEARGVKEKGWAHKSGKLVMTRIRPPYYPYHLQMIVMKPRVFGTTKEQINKHIKSHWDVRAHGSPKDKDKNLDILWDKALAGKIDREVTIEEFVMKQGWSRVVIDDGSSSIENVHITERQMHKIAKSIDKKYGSSVLFPESSAFFELTGKEFSEVIYNKLDWDYYIKTGKYTAPKRSEIGSTMAQFREEEEMKSFKKYITEKAAKLSATFPYKGAEWKDFRGLENPTEREITTLMKKTRFKEVRFVVDSKGKMWAWDTNDALHDEVIFGQTGQKYNGDYAKGMINFMTQHDLDDLDPDTSAVGKLHVMVLNTRTVGTDFALKNRTMKAIAKKINAKGKDRVYWGDV